MDSLGISYPVSCGLFGNIDSTYKRTSNARAVNSRILNTRRPKVRKIPERAPFLT